MASAPGRATTGTATDQGMQATLLNKVSWGAIFAGVTIALVTQVILTLLGAGIGIATLDPTGGAANNPSAAGFSIGAGIWTLVSALISAFAGGYIAARMSGRADRLAAGLHGLTTWAFTTLLILYLLTTTVGSLVGGAISGVTSAIGSAGQSAIQAAAPALSQSNPLEAIQEQVRSTGNDPEALQARAVDAIRSLLTGDEQGAEEARNQAAQALAEARNIPVDQARQQVNQMEQEYRQALQTAEQEATQAAEATASVVSTGSLLAALALVLGAGAGFLGGRSGAVPLRYGARIA
ncbi:PhnA-like protein [Fulvimarina endophytica]|uniref:PhnA-like protein n=2 Tax=Fulvimarina endophytica TaxID=2293836 RepID=A0A371X5M1_9HYPH|nr:PhnA-like protein [Fulvimarina endophytica]